MPYHFVPRVNEIPKNKTKSHQIYKIRAEKKSPKTAAIASSLALHPRVAPPVNCGSVLVASPVALSRRAGPKPGGCVLVVLVLVLALALATLAALVVLVVVVAVTETTVGARPGLAIGADVVAILEVFKRRKDWEKLVAISCCVPAAAVLFWFAAVGSIAEDGVLVVMVEFPGADTTLLGVAVVFVEDERVP